MRARQPPGAAGAQLRAGAPTEPSLRHSTIAPTWALPATSPAAKGLPGPAPTTRASPLRAALTGNRRGLRPDPLGRPPLLGTGHYLRAPRPIDLRGRKAIF
ncbi:hypothetical protein NDU88_002026 [Pleurodeles waltl]|uniref:Uncharacterized protein n=1 Tax=Pleurodeles waltl TaxID=8319 RepID=A0AAV7L048_PLEWA|nr:hypothetical protein NDU88_002026 [Pleurodeles waltl]